MREDIYPGLEADDFGGMTPIGNTIRDAWAFGLLPEGEQCAGWTLRALQAVHERVVAVWEEVDYDTARLPEAWRAAHERIHKAAIARALELGWKPEERELPPVPDLGQRD
ncbi:MAG: hypothetical protein D6717_08230 [Gammaproteobacteria bacterium]|nr:MAG: hypothetical protein D6717_08230 [Gammaproteobacteria bacterium]